MDIQELIKTLKEEEVGFHTDDEENPTHVWIYICTIDDNFYDYGGNYYDTDNEFLQWLLECPLVSIANCSQCCGCAGW